MKTSSAIQTILTMATIGAVVGGVFWATGALNKRRLAKIPEFIGFDTNYWLNHQLTISHSQAKALADKAFVSVGYINDDEAGMLYVLKQAKTASNLSLISHYFKVRHNRNLGSYYADYMDRRSESRDVLNALKSLKQ